MFGPCFDGAGGRALILVIPTVGLAGRLPRIPRNPRSKGRRLRGLARRTGRPAGITQPSGGCSSLTRRNPFLIRRLKTSRSCTGMKTNGRRSNVSYIKYRHQVIISLISPRSFLTEEQSRTMSQVAKV